MEIIDSLIEMIIMTDNGQFVDPIRYMMAIIDQDIMEATSTDQRYHILVNKRNNLNVIIDLNKLLGFLFKN